MNLILVRHARAEGRDPHHWPDDRERPLTSEGAGRFRAAARGLARIVPPVACLWASPYRRAWQTAEILHQEAGWPEATACSALEPGAGPDAVLARLRAAAASGDVALVGHEPDLGLLLARLLIGRTHGAPFALKKGAAVGLRFEVTARSRAATLLWFLPPAVLRAMDPDRGSQG